MRPKFGLIRASEFTMKDLYTFDKDISSARETYELVSGAYRRIFSSLGVPFSVVSGDAGVMGGSLSHEYHYPCDIGQDKLLLCNLCGDGYNVETLEDHAQKCTRCQGELTPSKGIEV